jgi:hypothetical protein
MEMPKPGEAHKKLEGFVGTWSGSETMYPSPWSPTGGTAKANVVNRSILDGFAVVQEYEQRAGKTVTFRGHGVFWFDEKKGEYVMTWWDSANGSASEFRGSFEGDVLTMSSPSPDGGSARVVWDISKPGRYGFAMQSSQDGQTWQPSMDGSYKRAAAATAAVRKAPAAAKKAAKKAVKAVKKVAARVSKATKAVKKVAKKAAKKAKRR